MFPDLRTLWIILWHVADGERCDIQEAPIHLSRLMTDYRARLARYHQANRRAMRLLRSLLSPEQRLELRRHRRSFTVIGSRGGRYRLWPYAGTTERIAQHGKYAISEVQFCLHEEGERDLPPADLTIAHLLMLRADEERFLIDANHHPREHMGWNGDWHRRLRAARIARAQLEAEAAA